MLCGIRQMYLVRLKTEMLEFASFPPPFVKYLAANQLAAQEGLCTMK